MVDRRRPDASRDEQNFHLPQLIKRNVHKIRRIAQWPYNIGKMITLFKLCHPVCLRADRLKNNRDRSVFFIIVTDCKRNTLSLAVNTDNQKLSGKCSFRHSRSPDLHQVFLRSYELLA